MGFVAGKLAWYLLCPSNFLLLLIAAGGLVGLTGRRWGYRVAWTGFVVLFLVATFPVGEALRRPLEERFAAPDPPPARVDGIIVLGGGIDPQASAAWGQPALGPTAERFTALVELGRRWPQATLVFTGGVGSLRGAATTEAAVLRDFYARQGFDLDRIVFEDRSRNTVENALFTKALVDPQPGQVWLLVTSASHMPRAMGVFRKAGWDVTAWPVDYRTRRDLPSRLLIQAGQRLDQLDEAFYEWEGLLYYRLRGHTAALFPAP